MPQDIGAIITGLVDHRYGPGRLDTQALVKAFQNGGREGFGDALHRKVSSDRSVQVTMQYLDRALRYPDSIPN